jgi:hypothetical protein
MSTATPRRRKAARLYRPHPDDEASVRAGIAEANARRFLSPAATDSFLRWLEGSDDESWRAECGSPPGSRAK